MNEGMSFPGGAVVKSPPAMQETQETWVRSLGWEGPLEEGIAAHSRILAWEIPRTEEPGRLQPTGPRSFARSEHSTTGRAQAQGVARLAPQMPAEGWVAPWMPAEGTGGTADAGGGAGPGKSAWGKRAGQHGCWRNQEAPEPGTQGPEVRRKAGRWAQDRRAFCQESGRQAALGSLSSSSPYPARHTGCPSLLQRASSSRATVAPRGYSSSLETANWAGRSPWGACARRLDSPRAQPPALPGRQGDPSSPGPGAPGRVAGHPGQCPCPQCGDCGGGAPGVEPSAVGPQVSPLSGAAQRSCFSLLTGR